MIKQKLIIYLGRNSTIELPIFLKSTLVDFVQLGITSISLEINGTEYSSDKGYIDYSANNGLIKIMLGGVTIVKGEYQTRLIFYSQINQKGKVIFSEKTDNQITVEFV